jgi:transcriptional regulator with XRE-family HTH domain
MDLFSDRLKNLRKEKKKTQQNIADLLKIRRSTYGEYERGKIIPPMDKIKTLADYFGVSTDFLINNVNTEKQEIDASDNIQQLLSELKGNQNVLFDGDKLDNESRQLLIKSLENSLEMAKIIKGK